MPIRLLLYSLFVVFVSLSANAQCPEDRIKANVLYHISDFISWPPLDKGQTFNIDVIGDRPELVDELSKIAQKKKIARRSLNITVQNKLSLNERSQIIFVDAAYYESIDQILSFCQRNSILMVTDQLENPLTFVINFTKSYKKNVSFQVNKQNLILSGLDYVDDLLLYGGTEVDIKDLFFKTQMRLDSTTNQLKQESIKISNLEHLVASKNQTLRSQDSTISAFADSIVTTRQRLKQQFENIAAKTKTIDQLTNEITAQNEKVFAINSKIKNQLELQDNLTIQINRNKEELKKLQREILVKNETLDEQDAFILNQRRLLSYSFALAGMLALLGFTIFRFFQLKKKHNAQLEQKIDERTIELKQSNEKFLSLFNNAPEAIWEIDFSEVKAFIDTLNLDKNTPISNDEYTELNMECARRMRFINVNKAALDLFEITDIDKSIEIYERLESSKKLSGLLPEFMCIIQGTHTFSFETSRWKARGERIDLIVKWLNISKEPESFSRVIVTMVDISKLRQVQTELKAHQERLELLVEEKTQNLKAINEELEFANNELFNQSKIINSQNSELRVTLDHLKETQTQLLQSEKMASLGVLTAGVAHEINNPLNFIMGAYVGLEQYFQEEGDSGEDMDAKSYLKTLKIGLDRATNIVKSLNLFSRENRTNNEDCNVNTIIENCLTMVNSQLLDRVEIIKKYSTEEIIVLGNVGRLHQVFVNIISNASQAISGEGKVEITTSLNADHAIIEVKDNGEGISEDNLPKITDPFFTTKEPGKGTGLGLSICYNIIREHGGEIKFDSNLGEGTTVSIKLPLN